MTDQKEIEKASQGAHPSTPFDQTDTTVEEGITHIVSDSKVTVDGLKVHPQPTTDPLDPLNWSTFQKHGILGIVIYFLFTYLTTTTVPSFVEIQNQYQISYEQVNWTVALPALGLSVGPLIWSSLSDIYGRRVIFLVGTLVALVSTVGAAVAESYAGYMATRFFQGFGVSPAATVGMAVVNDLFFDYERGQKLGLWVLAIDSGLLLGPTFGGFLDLVSPAWINWFNAILFAVLLLLELFFMPETLYPRQTMLLRQNSTMVTQSSPPNSEKVQSNEVPAGGYHFALLEVDLCRTKDLPFINLRPIPGVRHPKPWDSIIRFFITFKFPSVSIAVLGYCFLWYWWVLSVITMVPAAYANYTPVIQGLLFLGLFLGTVLSEIFCSGRLSDSIVRRLSKKRGNVRVAEMRLWLAYPAIVITAVGLILWGISIDKNYHWMVGQVAFFLFAAGIQIGNTVTSSYIVDSYPLQSMSVVTFYSVFLNLSAFVNPFFIAPWQVSNGWTWTFTTQGLIVLVGGSLLFGTLHKYGGAMRAKAPQPSWVNPEYDAVLEVPAA
ncbi:hypothetical protein PDE_07362 [Penicillium oxalicum 114-2]|uniref:Major facilitator superfamily (MFS) profile domain-containing protein n=1 Tax=Penicillium oxalicum (strain 114-2 / CGMCC 5302) TaxID=933388 RepID=S8BC02_PENO1|nr:hypothetical protein PDE_07362 [Penicillium oxalicum 114-2]